MDGNEVVAICPECHAKNVVTEPEGRDRSNLGRIPLLITFDCFKCKQRVTVSVAGLELL